MNNKLMNLEMFGNFGKDFFTNAFNEAYNISEGDTEVSNTSSEAVESTESVSNVEVEQIPSEEEKEIGNPNEFADMPVGGMASADEPKSEPSQEEVQMMSALENQQIPDEVLQELLALAKTEPEVFQEVISAYPELAQMLQEDIQTMNGGQSIEQ